MEFFHLITLPLINKTINYKLIGNVIFLSGLIIGVSVFFVFGVEQVAYPAGSIKFKASGIAKSLGVILFSMVPALMFYIVEDTIPKLSRSKVESLKTSPPMNVNYSNVEKEEEQKNALGSKGPTMHNTQRTVASYSIVGHRFPVYS